MLAPGLGAEGFVTFWARKFPHLVAKSLLMGAKSMVAESLLQR